MDRNWFLVALLTGILAVLLDFMGHILVFQQGITEPLPPVIYWVSKFFVVFGIFFLGGFFLRGFRPGIFLAIAAAFAYGAVWEFGIVALAQGYTYSIALHLFHLPAILVAWIFAWLLGRMLSPRALILIFLTVLIGTTIAITVLSLLTGITQPDVPY